MGVTNCVAEHDAQLQLRRVLGACPQAAEYVAGSECYSEWCAALVGIDRWDLENAVSNFLRDHSGLRGADWSKFPGYLIDECRKLHELRCYKTKRGPVFRGSVSAIAVDLGRMAREGEISRDESQKRVSELLAWQKGEQPQPEWMNPNVGNEEVV